MCKALIFNISAVFLVLFFCKVNKVNNNLIIIKIHNQDRERSQVRRVLSYEIAICCKFAVNLLNSRI